MTSVQSKLLQIIRLNRNSDHVNFTIEQWEEILELAKGHYIAPFLYTKLNNLPIQVPNEISVKLKKSYFQNTGRNLAIASVFKQIAMALETQNIPLIPLKGVYLAQTLYKTLGERVIGDFDLLVPKDKLLLAFEIATQVGFTSSKPLILEEWIRTKHQLCLQVNPENKFGLEWHWHIFSPTQSHQLKVDALWDRAVPIEIAQYHMMALSHEDTVLHLANHISNHHQFLFGFRNLIDLMLFCDKHQDELDWHLIGSRARKWGIDKGAFVAIYIVRHYLGAPIPAQFLGQFKPEGFSEEHVKDALQQLFVLPGQAQSISMTRQRIQSTSGIVSKGRELVDILFPTPSRMAVRYGIDPDKTSRLQMILIRWKSLAQQALMKIRQGGGEKTAVSQILKRRQGLNRWLSS